MGDLKDRLVCMGMWDMFCYKTNPTKPLLFPCPATHLFFLKVLSRSITPIFNPFTITTTTHNPHTLPNQTPFPPNMKTPSPPPPPVSPLYLPYPFSPSGLSTTTPPSPFPTTTTTTTIKKKDGPKAYNQYPKTPACRCPSRPSAHKLASLSPLFRRSSRSRWLRGSEGGGEGARTKYLLSVIITGAPTPPPSPHSVTQGIWAGSDLF